MRPEQIGTTAVMYFVENLCRKLVELKVLTAGDVAAVAVRTADDTRSDGEETGTIAAHDVIANVFERLAADYLRPTESSQETKK
ncbi:hypothetical protein [Phyllobacterium sp. K27]